MNVGAFTTGSYARRFDPHRVSRFRFDECFFDEATATAHLMYSLDNIGFHEQFAFPGAILPLTRARRQALEIALRQLHLVAGISYYKAAVPPKIEIAQYNIGSADARYLDELYFHGLREYAYRNRLDLSDYIHFPCQRFTKPFPSDLELPDVTAIPVGGGKDSIVTIEALKRADESLTLFSVGNPTPINDTCRIAGLPRITVCRTVDQKLFALNDAGAINGHVPISAIIAHVLVVCAILYGFRRAALSNERSANVGSLFVDGHDVNHQFSKSGGFEGFLRGHIQNNILAGFEYFSFLRPLSELGIARLFSRHHQYHDHFVSCNRAFQIKCGTHEQKWCCDCPKCRFVFLILAPFMSRERLTKVFGRDLLDDPAQASGFDDLLGLDGTQKPFECVGESGECLAAFSLLMDSPAWRNDALVRRFRTDIAHRFGSLEKYVTEALSVIPVGNMKPKYEELLSEIVGL